MRTVLLLQQESTISCGNIQLKIILLRNFGYEKDEQILEKGDNYLKY